VDKLFGEGVQRFPDYLPLYVARMRALMPRWGGNTMQLDAFIQQQAAGARGNLGPDERYARLYTAYSDLEEDELNVFAAGEARWPRVQAGFEGLRRRYPRSDLILNLYAKMACVAADEQKYVALRSYVLARRSSVAWSEKRSLESCDEMLNPARPR
jgi:hypothetical protein